jgi:hypothetical protein
MQDLEQWFSNRGIELESVPDDEIIKRNQNAEQDAAPNPGGG